MMEFNELGYKFLPQPPYSPDLAPSQYFLFSNLNRWLVGKEFGYNDGIITQKNTYMWEFDQYYLLFGKKLEKRWIESTELKREFVGK